jgi:hypothetical protein
MRTEHRKGKRVGARCCRVASEAFRTHRVFLSRRLSYRKQLRSMFLPEAASSGRNGRDEFSCAIPISNQVRSDHRGSAEPKRRKGEEPTRRKAVENRSRGRNYNCQARGVVGKQRRSASRAIPFAIALMRKLAAQFDGIIVPIAIIISHKIPHLTPRAAFQISILPREFAKANRITIAHTHRPCVSGVIPRLLP